MNLGANLSVTSLLIASSLVLVSMLFSASQKLRLEKDILIGVVRAVVQLIAVGYLLDFIFGMENPLFTALLMLVMIVNAASNAAKRGKGIEGAFLVSFLAIGAGSVLTLGILVLAGALQFVPSQIIPVSGMIVSNAMVAIGLCFRQLTADFEHRREDVETRLSLGADVLPSAIEIIRESIRTGMIPTIDAARTLGIVSLPGMMTGLILAGTPPVIAVRYQIMVTFMLLSTTAVASFLACYLAYRTFFTARKQLR